MNNSRHGKWPYGWYVNPILKNLILTMKFTLIFLFFCTVGAQATSLAQQVNLKVKNASVEQVLSQITQQTGFRFLYSQETISEVSPITLEIKNADVEEALETIFSDQHLAFKQIARTITITREARPVMAPQNRLIRGVVRDSLDVLPGVSVTVKGENLSTLTDAQGRYTLNVPQDATLIFRFVGYQTVERVVGNQETIDITMIASNSELEEVVVVGYGTQRRRDLVGSVAQIDGEEITRTPAMNITNTLAGRLPGLTALQTSGRPGADNASLRIRGISTYGGNQSPLIIIDGVQRPSFSHLDASEIESVTLLKDAVSTAVYGLQAANGIILITTKTGKEHKPTISYSGSAIVGQNTRFPEFLNGPDYMEWFNKATDVDNDYLSHIGGDPVPYVWPESLIDDLRAGTNTNPLIGDTDWVGELVDRTSLSQHHSISVSGGGEKVKYFTSVSHLDQDGVIEKTGFKRYNLRSNIDAELNEILSVSLNLGLRQQHTYTPGISPDDGAYSNPFYQAARMLPNLPMYTEEGIPTAHRSSSGWVNPLATIRQSGYQRQEANVFQGSLTFNVNIPWVEGLKAKVLTSYDKTGTEHKNWLEPFTLMGRESEQITGSFVEINTLSGITKSTLRQIYNQNNRQTFQPSLNYSNTFGAHAISGLLLYEWSRYQNNLFSAGARNFPITGLHEIDYGSFAPEDLVQATGSSGNDARAGYVARFNYSYLNRYLIEVAARYDASVNFPEASRWDIFPAIGLGWIVSDEDFFRDKAGPLNYLKIKTSLGKAGNDRINSAFSYLQTYQLTTDPVHVIGGIPVAAIVTDAPPNAGIRWETSTTANLGFESLWFEGKLGLDFEWFYRRTEDILNRSSGLYPPSMGGYFPAYVNYGIMDNRGFDLQIRYQNAGSEFRYAITGNLNWARNKIIRRDENTNLPEWQRTVGRSYGEKLGFIADGIYQNWEEAKDAPSPSSGIVAPGFFRYRDLNGDGRITRADDRTFIGRSNIPELTFGLNLNLQYKGFDFSALIQGAALSSVSLAGTYQGSSGVSGIDSYTVMTRSFYQNGNSPYFLVEEAWSPDNPDGTLSRLTAGKASLSAHNAHGNSAYTRDGSYVRLKSAQLGYTLPASVINREKIQQIRIFVSGSNLFTLDHLKYIDPEMPNVNNGFYPQQRLISAGLNVTF